MRCMLSLVAEICPHFPLDFIAFTVHRHHLPHASARRGCFVATPWICRLCLLISWSPQIPQTDVVIVCTRGLPTRPGRASSVEVACVPPAVDLFGYTTTTLHYVVD